MARKKKVKKPKETRSKEKYNYLVKKGKEFAKALSEKPTKWELLMKKALSDLHYKFEFQVPVVVKTNKLFILDFLLPEYMLVIEVDGGYHNQKEQIKQDKWRTKLLLKEGFHILRLANNQVSMFTKEQIDQIIRSKIQLVQQTTQA